MQTARLSGIPTQPTGEVVGIKMLDSGNIVLHDSEDNYIWQSFDFPTDILCWDSLSRLGRWQGL
ncbi:hypothetical protein CDL15_Pgr002358 [Punica granatum]|uniref:Bulb-type lectin domain-containing protein n=1 Tax=Punica granatum TaxID=22663 RepID=A0A218XVQ1_PUNGR|nr:hypothetical protein CDL15_Pgr002358 [Punica granatum]